jgi:hypothetical protein
MSKWILVAFLVLQAHFAASYLVPLDRQSQREFGGLLRWIWPWADGDGGPLGQVTVASGFPLAGFFLAVAACVALLGAAAAAGGFWIPVTWWRPLAAAGAALLLCLMALFFGATKLLPATIAVFTLWAAYRAPATLATG